MCFLVRPTPRQTRSVHYVRKHNRLKQTSNFELSDQEPSPNQISTTPVPINASIPVTAFSDRLSRQLLQREIQLNGKVCRRSHSLKCAAPYTEIGNSRHKPNPTSRCQQNVRRTTYSTYNEEDAVAARERHTKGDIKTEPDAHRLACAEIHQQQVSCANRLKARC